MDNKFGLKRTASLPDLRDRNKGSPQRIQFQKVTHQYNNDLKKFQEASFRIDILKNQPVFKDWTEFDPIIEKCTDRVKDLALFDFIYARDVKSLKIVIANLKEVLDVVLPIRDFMEYTYIQANGGPKKPKPTRLEWYP